MESVVHKFIKLNSIERRLYQETILGTATKKNTLVVLPTGLGKTYIAALLAAQRLEKHEDSKIIFLAPTKPLVEQHKATWNGIFNFDENFFKVFTGLVSPSKRPHDYEDAKFIFATPQVIQNDLISGNISLENVSLMIFDEAHRATGNYPYGFIAKEYFKNSKNTRILAITASPGSTKEKIDAVCKELFIDAVEIRSRGDYDVLPYVKKRYYNWIEIELPKDFLKLRSIIENVLRDYLKFLKNGGIIESADKNKLRKTHILELQGKLALEAQQNIELYQYLSALAAVMKLYHAIELLETQGISQLNKYFKGLYSDSSKAAKKILEDSRMKAAIYFAESLYKEGIEHPKMQRLIQILPRGKKAIIFAHYRASVERIIEELKKNGIMATSLIGQSSGNKDGLTQKEQIQRISEFKEGKYEVLVATSIGEEGLDIPAVDNVILYEPVPSAIRSIQRCGRTARHSPGKISILVTKGTKDEAYYWSAYHGEKKTNSLLKNNNFMKISQSTLDKYEDGEKKIVVIADTRESGSGILKELHELGVEVRIRQLNVADFQLSERVGVERKEVSDFLESLIDGRLLSQIHTLMKCFEKPIIMVEGESLYGLRNIHPNSIRGSLAALAVDFGIPIIYSKDYKDSAAFLNVIARREQLDLKKDVQLQTAKKPENFEEMQQFIVESLPNVGPALAKKLLERFGSVRKIFNASEMELMEVVGIGEKKAIDIKKVIETEYKKG